MNRKEYKRSMSGIHPSEQTIERIMDMTYEKKAGKNNTFKRIASAALALAIFVAGGVGINHMINSNKPLSVMVAYADEFMRIKSGTKQEIIQGVYFAPADDIQKNREQLAKAQRDYDDIVDAVGKLDENETASWQGVGTYEICNKEGETVAKLYTSGSGYFAADKTNYNNVKSFTVENESEEGYLQFEWSGLSDLIESGENIDDDNHYSAFINHKFTLTGDELRESQDNYNKYGYRVNWIPTASVFESYTLESAEHFDATHIKDKITFTFEYEDGSIESTSINIGFDSYGHMQIS